MTVLINAAWSFFGQPRAVFYNNKTYIGFINKVGMVLATEYNHTPRKLSWPHMVKAVLQVDDHAMPQLLVRASDQKILAFYSAHNGANLYMRPSANAESIKTWGLEVDLDTQLGGDQYSYPTPVQLLDETNDPIYLFFRAFETGTYRSFKFSKSTDGGTTWAAETTLFTVANQRPYFQVFKTSETRIDFAVTDGHPAEIATNSLYHFYYEGGNYYKSDGTLIGDSGALPLGPSDVTKVYDGASVPCWVWDIAIDGSVPVIVYATFPTAASDHRYSYARWTGATWEAHEICQAGGPLYAAETYYSGGVSFDHTNPDTTYCSRQVSGQFELFRYVTADNGATWTATQLTSGSSTPNMRPYTPLGSSMPVLWMRGRYTTFTDYDTALTRG